MEMFDKKLDVKIMEFTTNRISTIPDVRKLLHDADRILIASEMEITSRNTNIYIFQMNAEGEIMSIKVDICKIFPWVCAYIPQQISPFGQ